jgi:hypothetical protein
MASRLLDRLDDAINPIVVKELRQAVKSRLVVSSLLFFLLLQVVILGAILLFREAHSADGVDYQAGQVIFEVLNGILLGICLLLVPAYAGIRLAAERSDTNVDLLFISTLKPRSIIWGKFLAAVVLVLLIVSACAPFMTFTYLLRGIDIPTILFVLLMDFLVVLSATMLAIFIASIPVHRALKGALFLGMFGAMIATFSGMIASTNEIVTRGTLPMDTNEFWAVLAAVVGAILCALGQFYVWSVALVSPPSANRALVVRIYSAAAWLVTLAAATTLTYVIGEPPVIYTWQGLVVAAFCLQMTISISERDHWGPRVARTIPRRSLLRGLAFLFYSGAAGGILYGVLFIGLALAAGPLVLKILDYRLHTYPGATVTTHGRVAFFMALVALYAYDYGLLAVLLRRTLFRQHLKASLTWLIAVILVALGCALPYIFLLTVPQTSWQFEQRNPWIMLTNPVTSVIMAANSYMRSVSDFDDVCMAFVAIVAMLLTLANLPWIVRQMRDFRPPARKAVPAAVPVEPLPRVVDALPNGDLPVPPEAVMEPGGVRRARADGQP